MPLRRPFVYIASLRRTGSTMLANLLTELPRAYVFREPRIGLGKLRVRPDVANSFSGFGVDLIAVKKAMRDLPREEALERFAAFIEELSPHVEQLGIKEITHDGHEDLSRLFPEMRVVVTVRDVRDIYLSLYHRRKELLTRGKLWFETQTLLPYLREQSDALFRLMSHHDHLVVRYEDLCRDSSLLDQVRAFVDSPVAGLGSLEAGADRRDLSKHGAAIDATRVGLFQHETDDVARHNATYLFEEMEDYNARFGYRTTP